MMMKKDGEIIKYFGNEMMNIKIDFLLKKILYLTFLIFNFDLTVNKNLNFKFTKKP